MRTSRGSKVFAAITLMLAAVGLMTGCSASTNDTTSAPAQVDVEQRSPENDGAAPDVGGGAAGEAPSEQGPGSDAGDRDVTKAEQALIVETTMGVRAESLDTAVGEVQTLSTEMGGRIEHRAEHLSDRYPNATFTIRVPADRHDELIGKLKELGDVSELTTTATDVTLEKVDLESRIASLESSIKSLRGMLEQAENVDEMLQVESQLSQREADLESLQAQYDALTDRVAMSTIDLSLAQLSPQDDADEGEPPVFLGGLAEGWDDFVRGLGNFANAIGYALPGLLLTAAVIVALWFFVVRKQVRRWRAEHGGTTAAPDARGDLPPLPAIPEAEANRGQEPSEELR